jgi:hypothetical protein
MATSSARRSQRQFRVRLATALLCTLAACGGDGGEPRDSASGGTGQAGTSGAGGASSGAGGLGGGGRGGTGTSVGMAGTSGTAGASGAGAMAGAAAPDAGPTQPPPASCGDAARAYTVASTMLDASLVPEMPAQSWGGAAPRTPVAVDPETGKVFVGFTRAEGASRSVVIAAEGSAPAEAITAADAVIGGVAVTSDGVAALLFDPNSDVDMRMWAAVARFGADGSETFRTDLFRSPNLDDEGTKGAPSSGRLGYVPDSDELVAYFGHTQRYDDGVRHQGGYLATLNATGVQELIDGWFGSHNLDQRLLIDGARIAVLGLGDAFPKGIFFSYTQQARTNVIYRLAADGVGSTNGQLGGMIAIGDQIISPFITNRSISQDLDAGPWPDTDEAISMQIREAAAAGTDLGLLPIPKASLPDGDVTPIWLDAAVASGARLGSLKATRYGTADLILIAWAEITGDRRNQMSKYYTTVVDPAGAVCQPKAELPAMHAFTPGDDIVTKPDGTIVWANITGGRVQIMTLTP